MGLRRRDVLKVMGSSIAGAAATKMTIKNASADIIQTIEADVVVVGGGSAGTYTAVRLGDLGKSVVVVEAKDRLGGHAETVDDSATGGVPIDIGVVVFEAVPLVTNYFARFNTPLAPVNLGGGAGTAYVDFRSGQTVNYTPPSAAAEGAAIGEYLQLLATQFPYLDSGFNLPNPVPADLLGTFGAFVQKYNLGAIAQLAFAFGQGLGNLLEDPALYVLKNFSLSVVGTFAQGGFLSAVNGTSQLYTNIGAYLGNKVLYNSQVVAASRGANGVEVDVLTPQGLKRIRAGKLVVAIPPTLPNLLPLVPTLEEAALFSLFRSNYYTTALVKLAGIPPYETVSNVAPETPYNLAPLPGIYGLQPTAVEGLWNCKYGSATWLPDAVIQANIVADINRLSRTFSGAKFEQFLAYSNHSPFEMMVSPQEIAAGFYSRVNALQGQNSTFYTGAAFQTNDSSLIWAFTESLLPSIAA